MPRPLIFVSHKHNDRAIATVVRSFITEQTRSTVDVFQSSDPTALTPGVGRTLNADLRRALWHAGAVILDLHRTRPGLGLLHVGMRCCHFAR